MRISLCFHQPTAITLTQVIVDPDRIVDPLIPVLQDAIADHSFADLRIHLPEGLCNSDVVTIIQNMAVPRVSNTSGVTVCSQGEVIFVTSAMIQFISTKLLPPLIETFANKFAVHLDSLEFPVEHMDTMLATKGRKSRKTSTSNRPKATETVVPLHDVATAVLEAYPNLAIIQQSYGTSMAQTTDCMLWEIDDGMHDNSGGPVLDLCRKIVYTSAFQESCRLAVDAEVERLRSTKNASSVRNRRDGAAKIRSIESSFEETFAAACHQLFLHSKIIEFSNESDADVDATLIRNDFLRSIAACFASRITQYCLFKNELEGDIFSISADALDGESSGSPTYCQPIDRSQRRYPQPYLACIVDRDGTKQKPLPTLRKVLSGSLGVTLARLWTHCGSDSYDDENTTKNVEDESCVSVRPGNVDEFMSFVEENCLTICGLPYSKLNKKSEKQYVFARRQELTATLEKASDPAEVLELTIMLLFQQLRGLVVAGPYLTGPILQLLCKDKKIPESVAVSLQLLAKQIRCEEQVDEGNLVKVKTCGLSKDILKHCLT
jgi:E3 UFM1-protein ligase 1